MTSNTTSTDNVISTDHTGIPEDKLLMGVGLGAALLFALCFIAVIGAVACRGQYVKKGRRGRRLRSTVSLAYSDFETYKAARPSNTPSTDISILSSSTASIYATPIKQHAPPTRTSVTPKTTPPSTIISAYSHNSISSGGGDNGSYDKIFWVGSEDETLKTGGWRYIEPMISLYDLKSQSESSLSDQAPPRRGHRANRDAARDGRGFSTKILSPDFTGKRHKCRGDHIRPKNFNDAPSKGDTQ